MCEPLQMVSLRVFVLESPGEEMSADYTLGARSFEDFTTVVKLVDDIRRWIGR